MLGPRSPGIAQNPSDPRELGEPDLARPLH